MTIEQLQKTVIKGKYKIRAERLNPLHSKHLEQVKFFSSKKKAIEYVEGGYGNKYSLMIIYKNSTMGSYSKNRSNILTKTSGTKVSGVTKAKRQLKKHYGDKLSDLLLRRDVADKKSVKRKLSKKITEVRKDYKRYC